MGQRARYLIHYAPSDEGVGQLGNVPVTNHGLIPVAVAPAAQVCCVGCEVGIKALQEPIRPELHNRHIRMLRHW